MVRFARLPAPDGSFTWKPQSHRREEIGLQIIKRAIEAPLRQLADNAGLEGALIVAEVKKGTGNLGYNVATGNTIDLVKAGIACVRLANQSRFRPATRLLHQRPPADH